MVDAPHWQLPLRDQKDAARSIKEAVHTDIDASRTIYDWVRDLCVKLGASPDDLVPFEKYAAAAQGARAAVVRGARVVRRRAEHRARRQARAKHRGATRTAQRLAR